MFACGMENVAQFLYLIQEHLQNRIDVFAGMEMMIRIGFSSVYENHRRDYVLGSQFDQNDLETYKPMDKCV